MLARSNGARCWHVLKVHDAGTWRGYQTIQSMEWVPDDTEYGVGTIRYRVWSGYQTIQSMVGVSDDTICYNVGNP